MAGTELMFPEAMQINSFQLTSLIEVFNLTATPLITFVYMKAVFKRELMCFQSAHHTLLKYLFLCSNSSLCAYEVFFSTLMFQF